MRRRSRAFNAGVAIAAAAMLLAAPDASALVEWSREFTVISSPYQNYTGIGMWADGAGRAAVTWTGWQEGPPGMWLRLYEPGSGWKPIVQFGSSRFDLPRIHAAAFATDGSLWIAHDSEEQLAQLVVVSYTAQRGLANAEVMTASSAAGVGDAQLLADGDGDLLLAWSGQKDSNGRMDAAWKPKGAPWSASVRLDNQSGQVRDFDLDMRADGTAVLVFTVERDGVTELWVRLWGPTSQWGAGERLEAAAGRVLEEPTVLAGNAGRVTLAWVERDLNYTTGRLLARTLTPGGNWTAPFPITQAGRVETVGLAKAPAGAPVVTWAQSDGGGLVTCRSEANAAGNWSRPDALHEGTGASQSPVIASSSGATWAVWGAWDQPGLSVWARQYTAGAGWQPPERVSQTQGSSAEEASVAVDGRGVAWVAYRASSFGETKLVVRAAGLPAGEDIGKLAGSGGPSPVVWLMVAAAMAAVFAVIIFLAWRKAK